MHGDQLRRYLQRTTAKRGTITLDDDAREILRSEGVREGLMGLRLHGSFLDAPLRILRALAGFIRKPEPQTQRRVEKLYRSAGLHRVGTTGGERRIVLRHRGEHFDLKEIFDALNARWFDGRVKAFITWGRRTNGLLRSRSIHFGSYNWTRRVIRVHPDLDREYVPRFFVESVIYHEMLHADLGIVQGPGGRRLCHSAEFQRQEQAWPDYQRAKEWEKSHLHLFLRGATHSGSRRPRRSRAANGERERRAARRGRG